MKRRITICVDVELNDVATSKLESILIERLSDVLDGDVYKEYVKNIDSCQDEIDEEG